MEALCVDWSEEITSYITIFPFPFFHSSEGKHKSCSPLITCMLRHVFIGTYTMTDVAELFVETNNMTASHHPKIKKTIQIVLI